MRHARIRSDLTANKEDRQHFKRRAHEEAFGIYRPLTTESSEQIHGVLAGAARSVKRYLYQNRGNSAEMFILPTMGVTFIEKGRVQHIFRSGQLQRGFNMGRMMQQIESNRDYIEPSLEVPIRGFAWMGKGDRKLATRIEPDTDAQAQLEDQATILEEYLHQANGSQLQIETPDHVTLLRYGYIGDGQKLRRHHADDVKRIVRDHLYEADITTVTLGAMVIGSGYDRPLSLADH